MVRDGYAIGRQGSADETRRGGRRGRTRREGRKRGGVRNQQVIDHGGRASRVKRVGGG